MAKRPLEVPAVPASLPKRGNPLMAAVARSALRRAGWRIEGGLPDLRKVVAVMAPHTSNWDFVLAMTFMFAVGIRFSWLGKDALFRGPLGPLMRWLGGVPVRRDAPTGVVGQAIAAFGGREKFILVVAPEGTRKATSTWKTGFHRIALGAGVPLFVVSLDYPRKLIILGPLLEPSDDAQVDIDRIQERLQGVQGKFPHGY